MKTTSTCFVVVSIVIIALAPLSGCGLGEDIEVLDDEHSFLSGTSNDPAARRALAESGRYLRASRPELGIATAWSMAEALDIPAEMIGDAQLTSPDPLAALDLPNLGIIVPRKGSSFAALSTGLISTTPTPEPGTDFSPIGADGDQVTLRIAVNVPTGADQLSFDFNFISAESPEYIGSGYNDEFVARVTDAWGTREIARASVNSSFFHPVSATRGGGTGYELYVDDPSGVDEVFGAGAYPPGIRLFPDAGITGFQTATIDVADGGLVTLEFVIRDQGDGVLDSMVLLDNVAFSGMEVLDPNPSLIHPFSGRVRNDPAELAAGGAPVHGVAADGATQLLLRVSLPGPGQVEFAIDGPVPENGSLSAIGTESRLGSVMIDTVEAHIGRHYAFALYRSPDSFNADSDSVLVSAHYFPAGDASEFRNEQRIYIYRPPVLVVHDLWFNCTQWSGTSLFQDDRFDTHCVEYSIQKNEKFETHQEEIGDGVDQVILTMRSRGIAATQVDLIGHGMGGLLARNFVDGDDYRSALNFKAGSFNRLITMNTPHLGTRMADEIVAFREFVKENKPDEWREVQEMAAPIKWAIDNLWTESEEINGISRTGVPSHAIISTGGLNILRPPATSLVPADPKIKALYFYMENYHPETVDSSWPEKHKLIFGNQSKVFCSDDHDLFVTAYDQAGGIDERATTTLPVDVASANAHWSISQDKQDRIVELLNTPVSDPAFSEFPSPGDVPRVNHCPPALAWSSASPMLQGAALGTESLEIAAPVNGTLVSPGSTVPVRVQAGGGFVPEVVLIQGTGNAAILEMAPFDVNFEIPAEAIGEVELVAAGIDAAGNLVVSNRVTLPVVVTATLQSMEILGGDAMLFGTGTTRRLTVLGHYNDAVTRNISSSTLGTVYSSSHEDIVTVSDDGLVTAVGNGTATVVARHGAAVTSISVTVRDRSCWKKPGKGRKKPGKPGRSFDC